MQPASQGYRRRRPTGREHQILRLIGHGHTNREVAERLGLSVKTVHTHRKNLMGKLGVYDVPMLLGRALQLGFLDT